MMSMGEAMRYCLGEFVYDEAVRVLEQGALHFRLSDQSSAILEFLIRESGKVVPRRAIFAAVTGGANEVREDAEFQLAFDSLASLFARAKTQGKAFVLYDDGSAIVRSFALPVETDEPAALGDAGGRRGLNIAWAVILILAALEAYFVFFHPFGNGADELAEQRRLHFVPIEGPGLSMVGDLNAALAHLLGGDQNKDVDHRIIFTGHVKSSDQNDKLALTLVVRDERKGRLIWAGYYPLEDEPLALTMNRIKLDLVPFLTINGGPPLLDEASESITF